MTAGVKAAELLIASYEETAETLPPPPMDGEMPCCVRCKLPMQFFEMTFPHCPECTAAIEEMRGREGYEKELSK